MNENTDQIEAIEVVLEHYINGGKAGCGNDMRAAFHEELYKYLILVYFCSRRTEFNEQMDAIVYGVAVSLGYAAFENVEYVLGHVDYDTTWQSMAAIRVLPTIMHAVNGVIMGFLLSNVLFVHFF